MSKAVEYIKENTKNFSNALFPLETGEFSCKTDNFLSWITPTEARMAVEIAREEIYEWLRVNLCNYFDASRSMFEMCLDDLKQAMKDET